MFVESNVSPDKDVSSKITGLLESSLIFSKYTFNTLNSLSSVKDILPSIASSRYSKSMLSTVLSPFKSDCLNFIYDNSPERIFVSVSLELIVLPAYSKNKSISELFILPSSFRSASL